MSILKLTFLGAVAVATLAIGPATADAMTNKTTAWCKPKGPTDQVIVDGGFASLIWTTDGDLVLQPLNHLVNKIWSSGTAGAGDKVCWETSGTLAVYSAGGTQLWSKTGGSVPDLGSVQYSIQPSLSSCDLSARYSVWKTLSFPSPFPGIPPTTVKVPVSSGTMWTRAATCPEVSRGVVADDWCFERPPVGEERQIVQTPWSELVWTPAGNLVLRGTGISAGEEIWKTTTAGQGQQLCLAPTGQLAIYNALMQPLWSTTAGSTTTSHLLALDDCNLAIKPVDTTQPTLWTSSHRCPQATAPRNTQVLVGAETVLLENDEAQLVFDTTGNLVLRSAAGDEVWTSALAAGRGKRVAFQADGNLVVYDATNHALWGAKMWDGTVTEMVLEGCSLQLLAGTTVKWSRGMATCPGSTLTNTPAWEMPASGNLTLLRTPESRLVWQADGNLVLYTAGGAAVWSSDTWGRGKTLAFQGDGNLVVYVSTGNLWATNFYVLSGASRVLRLGDHCTFQVADAGTSAAWTGSDSCIVVNHTFERAEGDSLFGATMRNHLTARDDGTARIDNTTGIDLTILGARIELFSSAGYQTETDNGSDLGNASLTIFGETAASLNFTYEQTFFEKSRTFNVGPVPVVVTVGASGELGLSVSFGGGALTVTPTAGIYATVSAGVGGECDVGGASAGIRGHLTLIELGLPISLKVYVENGTPKYTIKGDLTISTLSGSFELYAEAYIKVWFVKVSADWSYELFSWKGLEWTKNLFSKSGGF